MEKHSGEPSPLLCMCLHATGREVFTAVEAGACDLESVRDATGANTGCGDCARDIEDLIADRQELGALAHARG